MNSFLFAFIILLPNIASDDGPCKDLPKSIPQTAPTWRAMYSAVASGIERRIEFRRMQDKTEVMRGIDLCKALQLLFSIEEELREISAKEVAFAKAEIIKGKLENEFLKEMGKSEAEGVTKFTGKLAKFEEVMKKRVKGIGDELFKCAKNDLCGTGLKNQWKNMAFEAGYKLVKFLGNLEKGYRIGVESTFLEVGMELAEGDEELLEILREKRKKLAESLEELVIGHEKRMAEAAIAKKEKQNSTQ